jgi:hypothetical protein
MEVNAHTLLSVQAGSAEGERVSGRVQNLSEGGLCFESAGSFPVNSFVCCEIALPNIPVSIPALMQVRWSARAASESLSYVYGLRFIAS